MPQIFPTGFGSKHDAEACHQPTVRKLVAHLNSNCKTESPGDTRRREEMILILQEAVVILQAVTPPIDPPAE